MKRVAWLSIATGLLLAGSGNGIRPRADSSDYAAHASAAGGAIGASIIPPDQVRKMFPADLNRAGYVVVEVAVYPAPDKPIKIRQDDFMLHGGSSTTRTASAETVTEVMTAGNKTQPPQIGDDRNVTVDTTTGMGTGSTVDPNTGRRGNGVYPGEGVGVGVGGAQGPPQGVTPASQGPPGPASEPGSQWPAPPRPQAAPAPPRDPAIIEQELDAKALPEGDISQPAAGYLYFPRPAKTKKNTPLDLTWYAPDGNVRLSLPPPGK
jgi:hypothetical protein